MDPPVAPESGLNGAARVGLLGTCVMARRRRPHRGDHGLSQPTARPLPGGVGPAQVRGPERLDDSLPQ
jgi:hypothetical protein